MRIATGIALVGIVALAFVLGQGWAQDGKDEAAGMDMHMPTWMKQTEEHANLKMSTGKWTVSGQCWMDPSMPGTEMNGTAERKSVLGGYYVEETFRGEFMGHAFEGRMLQGYDTVRKQHVSIWMDSTSPVMSVSRGTMEDGKLTLTGEDPDMMSGMLRATRTEVTHNGPDECRITMFCANAEGKMGKSMDFTYRRMK